MNRRTFIGNSAAVLLLPHARRRPQSGVRLDPAKAARLNIMTFNFSNLLKLPTAPASPARTLDVLDLPEMVADRFGVHNIEYQHSHFLSTDDAYLKDVRARVQNVKSMISQINLEFGPATFSAPDPEQRTRAVDLTKEWIDHAVALGCGRVMLNQGQLTPEKREFSMPTLKTMAEYGKSKGVQVAMETRAPSPTGRGRGAAPLPAAELPAAPPWVVDDATRAAWLQANPGPPPAVGQPRPAPAWMLLVEHFKAVPEACITPDVGGMGAASQDEMNAGFRALWPYNSGEIHINWRDNPQWDLPATIRLTRELGHRGIYTLEVAGAADPYAVTMGLAEVVAANI
jgi:hypothetical protein